MLLSAVESIQNLSPLGEELMEWHTCRQSTRKCTQISREKRFHNLVRKGLVFDWWQTNSIKSIQNLSPLGAELAEWHTCRQSTLKCTQISREKRFHNLVRKGLVFDWWQTNSIS
ncbi:hypothetical protein ACLB2K_055789 [Fragaria x ananassa]